MKTDVIIFSALLCASSLSAMDKACPSQFPKELYGTIAANAAARTTQHHKQQSLNPTTPEAASTSPVASPIASARMVQAVDNAARLPEWVIKCTSPKNGKPYYLNGESLQAFELLDEFADPALPDLLKN